jgi:5-oxopent-3-ene-1,2,5-tricarboxylate decarboxylase / 2-hydroxyhepta-2,4-diene-1,7-dioate isomerase
MTQTIPNTPWLPRGTVYGTLMNFACEHTALAAQMQQPPYKAAPQAPVLYIKTANTFSAHGSAVALPANVHEVQIRACIGLIFRGNQVVSQSNIVQPAINKIANLVLLNDLTVPHASFYRPPVRFKCIDGFLPAGPLPPEAVELATLDALTVTVRVNSQVVQTYSTASMVRSAAQLVSDVAEFIELQDGDVLMLGCPFDAPLARAGDSVEISAPGLASLRHTVLACSEVAT